MIEFAPPDPDTPVGNKYFAAAKRVKKMRQEQREHRERVLREMDEGLQKARSRMNELVGAFVFILVGIPLLWVLILSLLRM